MALPPARPDPLRRSATPKTTPTTAGRADWHRPPYGPSPPWDSSGPTGRAGTALLLIGCLRQGLRLARDFDLVELGWLTEAAWTYVSDSVWEPLAPPAHGEQRARSSTPPTPWSRLLSALARRQHEHRARTVARLTAVIGSGLLPADLQEMAVYYRAKASATSDAPTTHAADTSRSPTRRAAWPGRPARTGPGSPA